MYRKILIAVENSGADRTIVDHVSELARITGAELLLVHVADGWAARNFDQLKLRESEEMKADRAYLEKIRTGLEAQGFTVETRLAMGITAILTAFAAGPPDASSRWLTIWLVEAAIAAEMILKLMGIGVHRRDRQPGE